MMHNKYGDEREEGHAEDDDEEEKVLPDFQEGDQLDCSFLHQRRYVVYLLVLFVPNRSKN